jgi:hypothetical protein
MPQHKRDWDGYIRTAARKLGLCMSIELMKSELEEIDALIDRADDVPVDFWSRLADAYETAPKPLYEEAAAAASLNALVISAQALIRARGRRRM